MMWFKNKREGIVYSDLFDPILVHSIALILTVVSNPIDSDNLHVSDNLSTQQIESNLNEWIPGTKTEVTFGPTITMQFMTAMFCHLIHWQVLEVSRCGPSWSVAM